MLELYSIIVLLYFFNMLWSISYLIYPLLDDLEAGERQREELAARLQGPRPSRVPHQDRKWKGSKYCNYMYLLHYGLAVKIKSHSYIFLIKKGREKVATKLFSRVSII